MFSSTGGTACSAAALSSMVLIIDLLKGNKQHMWIMNVVWPITALYGSVYSVLPFDGRSQH